MCSGKLMQISASHFALRLHGSASRAESRCSSISGQVSQEEDLIPMGKTQTRSVAGVIDSEIADFKNAEGGIATVECVPTRVLSS